MERIPRKREPEHEPDARLPTEAPQVQVPLSPHQLSPTAIVALQRSAGNAAVSSYLDAQRREPPRPSPSRELRSLLRAPARRLQRAVTTSGGEWDTDRYDLLQDKDQDGRPVDVALGSRGVDMALRFKPANTVDAELIGLTQSVQAFVNNKPKLTPAASTRAIPSKDAVPINTGKGETDEGTAIDRASGFNNPIYAVKNQKSGSLDDNDTSKGWGQNGFHFTAGKAAKQQDATLIDTPMRFDAQKDSRHIFETTALATKGVQAGTYYGSVRWGWRTDDKGTFTKLPLEKVSDGVPSSTFLKAAGIWNPGKSSTGAENVDLPIPDVKLTSAPVNVQRPAPFAAVALPAGTRLQIVRDFVARD